MPSFVGKPNSGKGSRICMSILAARFGVYSKHMSSRAAKIFNLLQQDDMPKASINVDINVTLQEQL